jgi:uncharacterized membrane protein YbjE (DUF340 family)
MLIVFIFLTAGVLTGCIIKNRRILIVISEKLLDWAIYLLLFFLGLSTATSEKVINNIGSLGILVLIITAAAVCGSIIAGMIIYKKFFREYDEKQR